MAEPVSFVGCRREEPRWRAPACPMQPLCVNYFVGRHGELPIDFAALKIAALEPHSRRCGAITPGVNFLGHRLPTKLLPVS